MNHSASMPSPLERFAAFLLLLLFALVLLEIALMILVLAGRPILTASYPVSGVSLTSSCRFRTTGSGPAEFPWFAGFLRKYRLDQLPGLWSVVRGDFKLKDVLLKSD